MATLSVPPVNPRRLSHKFGMDFALNTGTNIPAMGFGTWQLEKERIAQIIEDAVEEGFRHFDCAYEYQNQTEIGSALHSLIESHRVNRNELFLTSKLWNTHHKKHHVYSEMDRTLRQLQVHHLDLWLMHWPLAFHHYPVDEKHQKPKHKDLHPRDQDGKIILDEDVTLQETWKAMEEMHECGKARAIGVSNFTLPMLRELLSFCKYPPAVLQLEYHPYLQSQELIQFCKEQGIHVTAYSPLGSQGTLDDTLPDLLEDATIKEIAKSHNKSAAQVILAWNIQNQISSIPKASSVDHMKENLQSFNLFIRPDDIKKIDSLDRAIRYVSPKKIWGLPMFDDETRSSDKKDQIECAVGDMYAQFSGRECQ